MHTTLRWLGGSVAAALLAVHLVGPVAHATGDCRATPLPLPADAPPTSPASSGAGDETGRYVIGHVHTSIGRRRPVLWTDGVPQWIAPQQAVALDVASDGTVVGMLQSPDGNRPWRATVSGGYEPLPLPDGIVAARANGINNRGDIVGQGTDTAGRSVPVAWPLTRPALVLRSPDGHTAVTAKDIDDHGLVIGTSFTNGLFWDTIDAAPRLLLDPDGRRTAIHHLRGDWLSGLAVSPDGTTDYQLWKLTSTEVRDLPGSPWALNAHGDVAVVPNPGDPTTIVGSDGTSWQFPEWTQISVLYDRAGPATAVGDIGIPGTRRPVVWTGCGPA